MGFENDQLNREKYGDFLTEIVSNPSKYKRKSDSESLSIAIDSGWGTGKTTFINMWKEKLETIVDNEGKTKFNIIEYNAWKNDFSDTPFESLIYTILKNKLFNDIKKDKNRKEVFNSLKNNGGKLLKCFAKIGVRILAGPNLDEIVGDAFNEISDVVDNGKIVDFYKDFEDYNNALQGIKDALKEVVIDKPLIVIIDELDRCKPLFAIKLLENIKHIFDVENMVFVFALDMEQLSHSIRCIYGQNMDASGYLCRFFDYISRMPSADIANYLKYLMEENPLNNMAPYSLKNQRKDQTLLFDRLLDFSRKMKLSLRDINTVYANFLLFEKMELVNTDNVDAYTLYWFLLILKYKYLSEFNNIFINGDISFEKNKFILDIFESQDYRGIFNGLKLINKKSIIGTEKYKFSNLYKSFDIQINQVNIKDNSISIGDGSGYISLYDFENYASLSCCLFYDDMLRWENIKYKSLDAYIQEKLEFFDFSLNNEIDEEYI